MEKRFFLIIPLMILIFSFSGCSQQTIINDPETGSINSIPKITLNDGTYIVTAQYFDHEGFRPSLTISIHEGVITKATFIEQDSKGLPRTLAPNQCKYSMDEITLTLISDLIKKQSGIVDSIPGAEKICEDFSVLSKTAIAMAKKENDYQKTIPLADTYILSEQWEDDAVSQLSISFDESGAIIEANYSETLDEQPTDSKSFFSELTEMTIKNNGLAEIPIVPNHQETCTHYNEMLTQCVNIRENGHLK